MSLLSSDLARLNAMIHLLGIVMTIGKYLPLIVAGFAVLNLTLAVLSFTVWNNLVSGVINSVFALGGFIFLAQLLRRRKIHRYEYRYHGRHSNRPRHPAIAEAERRASARVSADSASA
jgi:hypothetical protein